MPSIPVPIIDSHIHLYPTADLPTLAWGEPNTPLYRAHTLAEYRLATTSSQDLLAGAILVEADRRNDEASPDPATGWKHPLQEAAYFLQTAAAAEEDGERLVKGVVPWAPVPAGPEGLERYLDALLKESGGDKVKGVRYLLQDKPARRMLEDGFVQGVRYLGRRGLVFDVGVDMHRRGRGQIEEVVELVERAHEGVADGERVTFVLNHLCKPDLTITNPETDPSFIAWRTAMFTLSKADNTFIKLSGAFSEMTPEQAASASPDALFEAMHPWLAVVVATFGPARMLFGSDWPVCTVGVDGAWDKWRLVVERMCVMYSFDEEQTRQVFAGTARRAYRIG